jgi:hypothetical protein
MSPCLASNILREQPFQPESPEFRMLQSEPLLDAVADYIEEKYLATEGRS